MDTTVYENKADPDAAIASLTDRIGRAEAAGDSKTAKKLRSELEGLLRTHDEVRAERAIDEARARHDRQLQVEADVEKFAADVESLADRRAELGTRMRAALDELADAWIDHERLFTEYDRPLQRRRQVLAGQVHNRGLELEVASVPDLEQMLGVAEGILYGIRLAVERHERNGRGRVERPASTASGPRHRGVNPTADMGRWNRPFDPNAKK